MKIHPATANPGAAQITTFLIGFIGSMITAVSLGFVVWLATVVAL
jgi:hypothetical protein